MKGQPNPTDLTLNKTGMHHSESNGLIDICDEHERRKQGSTLISRQIELENMKQRQFKAKQQVSEKNLALR